MKSKIIIIIFALLLIGSVLFFIIQNPGKKAQEILVLCGGSMRTAMESVIAEYKKANPDENILTSYGDSGDFMAQIAKTRKGDIFVCHDPFMEWAKEHGYIDTWAAVAYLDVVIAVPKGNPKNIKTLKDLARPGLKLGIGDQKYSTSGIITGEIFKKVEYGPDIRKNIKMESKGQQQRAADIALGNLDAAIIWNAVAYFFREKLDVISIPKQYIDTVTSATYKKSDLKKVKVTIGILTKAKDNAKVKKFYEFSTTEGKKIFNRMGFTSLEEKK